MRKKNSPKNKWVAEKQKAEIARLQRQATLLTNRIAAATTLEGMTDNEVSAFLLASRAAKAKKTAPILLDEIPALTQSLQCSTMRQVSPLAERKELIEIHCDGGCRDNGTKNALGAWAYHVLNTGHEDSECIEGTTNNRAELSALIEAVKYAKMAHSGHPVRIYSDSQLTIHCATGVWKKKSNMDLWQKYGSVSGGMDVTFQWVRAHSGIPGNERCDELCNRAMDEITESIAAIPDSLAHIRTITEY